MKIFRLLAFACLFAALVPCASAQNATISPYSRYGYGLLTDNATAGQAAMGGVGYAMSSGRQTNVMNPASYAAIDSLTFLFDMGFDVNCLWASEGNKKEDNFSGGLSYITMAFPISKRLGASIGLNAFASTGYSFVESVDNASVKRDGNGDINQLYAGLGYNPFGGAYIGANFAYLFGSTTNDIYATSITGSTTLFQRYIKVKDFRLELGLQYVFPVGRNDKLTLGVAYAPGKGLHGETYGISYDASQSQVKPDTTGYTKLSGKYSLPATYGAGINYQWRNKLMLEADFTYQPWKDVKYEALEGFDKPEFDNRWKVAAGLQFTPNFRGSYFQRIQFRAGAYFNHDYICVRGNNVREMGATLGFGLPVPGFKTTVNLTFEYKHRQAHPTPLIKEQYLNITLGVNFNELWFMTRKIH